LGRADAQIANLEKQYPQLATQLQDIRNNLKIAQNEIQQKENTINFLAQRLDETQKKADGRLLWIWKLTTATLSLLLVAGGYIFWKLK
jgi:uncharacterized coiled-coil DUF342 family protein